ncbi:LOW QUALITY PROTEIN: hypothetical protein Cgig2_021806 [Carnegiea gigantea]|uniref:Uncharacterized protein n=1 Tax=Carnegiea gigantea TaxID=171969 RepID=A0A9Q1QEQ0_9CARY|nr:LOW QUALITY PROTEIN: hypothetical protein Cgig2_021806 [Carnegiea gigantea]
MKERQSLSSIPLMAFLVPLALRKWSSTLSDHCGVAFPPSSLPKDFQALCPSYDLVVAMEAAERFELPELPQVIFYAMLLSKAVRLGVLHGRTLRPMEAALTELRWSAFELWVWISDGVPLNCGCGCTGIRSLKPGSKQRLNQRRAQGSENKKRARRRSRWVRTRPLRGQLPLRMMTSRRKLRNARHTPSLIMTFPPLHDTREMANYVRESFIWCWRRVTRPPCPFPEDHHLLCPSFSLAEAERAAADFDLPEMAQVIFYAMLLNEAVDLAVVHGFAAESLRSAMDKFRGLDGQNLSRAEGSAALAADRHSRGPQPIRPSGGELRIDQRPTPI